MESIEATVRKLLFDLVLKDQSLAQLQEMTVDFERARNLLQSRIDEIWRERVGRTGTGSSYRDRYKN